ncbi:hypothetical protein PGTUg99_009216 [Puccinia graminis f. sp. tritici]|uniref:Uncharacterized protein n=1 Tax=Puccinia graminis f. sp. tritici TaxID=56615 RepID=A0A5B0R575_PUCGR|nr:hypothetical protein PGTUg99_009216 [Puccinia graminis f. sp. tritici]
MHHSVSYITVDLNAVKMVLLRTASATSEDQNQNSLHNKPDPKDIPAPNLAH